MTNETLYMMAKRNVVAEKEEVYLSDIATIYCADQTITAKVKAIKVYQFKKDKEERCVISVLHVIEQIVRMCPGITIENLGETDVIVKYRKLQEKENKGAVIKMIFVSTVCFIGTAFTIMAFHNDITITKVFAQLYQVVTGEETTYHTILEATYAIGLMLGILIFYNHFGHRTVNSDPTPLAVEMRVYEKDVDQAIIEMAEREDKKIDVGHK